LRHPVLEQLEILASQIGDRTVPVVTHDSVDDDGGDGSGEGLGTRVRCLMSCHRGDETAGQSHGDVPIRSDTAHGDRWYITLDIHAHLAHLRS
jgi:hypothetical protein